MSKKPESTTTYKLEMKTVLGSIDTQKLDFYDKLAPEERKAFSPWVIMRYMSSLPNNHPLQRYAILAVNDLINVGFGEYSKHPELQYLRLCCAGIGDKTYRAWIPASSGKKSNKNPITTLLCEWFPELNNTELEILISTLTEESLSDLARSNDIPEKQIKELMEHLVK